MSIVKWQGSTDGGATWSDLAWTNNPLDGIDFVGAGDEPVAAAFRAVVESGVCGSATSSMADVMVYPPLLAARPTQALRIVCSGTGTTVGLSGQIGAIVNWQASTDGGSSWSDIVSTNNPLSTGGLTQTTAFRAVVKSGACGPATSSVATVIVDPAAVGGTASPGASHVCSWRRSRPLALSGHVGTIVKWQASSDGGNSWSDIASTANPLYGGELTVSTLFRAVVTNGFCGDVSTAAAVAVDAVPVGGTAVALAPVVCSNSGTLITLTNLSGGIHQWQFSTDNWATTNAVASTDNPAGDGQPDCQTRAFGR